MRTTYGPSSRRSPVRAWTPTSPTRPTASCRSRGFAARSPQLCNSRHLGSAPTPRLCNRCGDHPLWTAGLRPGLELTRWPERVAGRHAGRDAVGEHGGPLLQERVDALLDVLGPP